MPVFSQRWGDYNCENLTFSDQAILLKIDQH